MNISPKLLPMKKFTFLIAGISFFLNVNAQEREEPGEVYSSQCVKFSISRPLREIAEEQKNMPPKARLKKEGNNERKAWFKTNPDALPADDIDPIWQKDNYPREISNPIKNFAGLGGGTPPDPSGAAGPNHYVQAVNVAFKVFNKSGSTVMSELDLSSLWPGSKNDGDPIVLYDKYADRWFISQFQTGSNSILIAISTSPDPTGTYYQYTFVPNTNDFPDYPKFSIWSDGYYMSSNFNTPRTIVYEREKMLLGDQSAKMLVKSMPGFPKPGFYCPLPSDADGQLPPFGTPCYFFTFEDDGWSSGTTDQIRIYKMTTNWSNSSASVVLATTLPVAAFNAVFSSTGSWENIPQKGTTQKLDAIAGVFNYRAQYRKWTGYNTVVLCHAVNVDGNGLSGIRWYELRQDDSTKVWSVYQQGTYAPDNINRWLGSIAMDDNGNIGMGYSVSGSSLFAGLRYTGRLKTDTLGKMTYPDKTAVTGSSSQSFSERYGDYSHTSLDPDGITFWHTGEYLASGTTKTRIFSFQVSNPITTELKKKSPEPKEFLITQQGNSILINVRQLETNEKVMVDLFDISGRQISSKSAYPLSGGFDAAIDKSTLTKGNYLVRIGNKDFQKITKIALD